MIAAAALAAALALVGARLARDGGRTPARLAWLIASTGLLALATGPLALLALAAVVVAGVA